jgi:hypothetical protein
MTLQKQKIILKQIERRVASKLALPRPHLLRMVEPAALAFCFLVMAFSFQPAKTQTTVRPTDTSKHKSASQQAAKPKKTKPVPKHVAPKAVTTTPTPAPPAATPPAATAGSSKVEPVVKPSPRSKVSGLSPTTPSGSSGGGGGQQVTTGYTSLNWSGYLATNATFTAVSASWIAPSATGNGSTTSADSTWIGIGGVTSSDLIQVGTQNIISASGTRSTSAFYEMLPDAAINITSMTVKAGDSMSASVREVSASLWTISIIDNTTGKSFSKTVSYASSLSSAEWIEEDPSYAGGSLVPFDNFHLASFTGARATANGMSVNLDTGTAQPVIMVNNSGTYIAVPSTIGADGGSFTVTP